MDLQICATFQTLKTLDYILHVGSNDPYVYSNIINSKRESNIFFNTILNCCNYAFNNNNSEKQKQYLRQTLREELKKHLTDLDLTVDIEFPRDTPSEPIDIYSQIYSLRVSIITVIFIKQGKRCVMTIRFSHKTQTTPARTNYKWIYVLGYIAMLGIIILDN